MSLARRLPQRGPDLRPWLPKNLNDLNQTIEQVAALSYIVVDEIVGDSVGLSLAPWPFADQQGRLRFDIPDGPTEIGVNIDVLCRYLVTCGHALEPRPSKVDERGGRYLRVGDVFGARVADEFPEIWTEPLDRWFHKPVYDMTVEARLVAKLAYYRAVAGEWSSEEAGTLRLREGLGNGS